MSAWLARRSQIGNEHWPKRHLLKKMEIAESIMDPYEHALRKLADS